MEKRLTATTWPRMGKALRAELTNYPGRVSLVGRITLACTSMLLLAMIFRLPGATLGVYYPLLLSRDSPRSTLRSAILTASACVLGTVEIVLGGMVFSGSPFLHFFWVTASLFTVFYLISSVAVYDTALAFGLLITNAITTWDLPIPSDLRVRQSLFTLLSILMGCAISVLIEYLFARSHTPDTVLAGIEQRLGMVSDLMDRYGQDQVIPARLRLALSRFAARGLGGLREHLLHGNYERSYKEQLAAALALSGRLVELALNLAELPVVASQQDRLRCSAIARNIAAIDARLAAEQAPDWLDLPDSSLSTFPTLAEIERTVDLIAQSFLNQEHPPQHHLPEAGEQRISSIFVPDAFTSHEHLRFAVRGCFSALACYVFFMSVGWTGLNASIATCVLTALSNTGASRHKQLLRFAGMILGACVLGFGAQILILPQVDSLFAFAALFSLVIAAGAWVSTSGPRIAYAGAQLVLAYDLVNVNSFAIDTSLVPARDAVLGILLGIAAMWLIFDHLWPTSSVDYVREMFVATIREIAFLHTRCTETSAARKEEWLRMECDRINRNSDAIRNSIDFAVFEPYSPKPVDSALTDCVKTLQPQLRSVLLMKSGLLHHETIAVSNCPALVSHAQLTASQLLLATAAIIENRASRSILEDGLEADENPDSAGKFPVDHAFIESKLCYSLLALTRHIHASVRQSFDSPCQATQQEEACSPAIIG